MPELADVTASERGRSTRRSTSADLAVIVTAHPGVDHEAIARRAPLTVDLRGVTRDVASATVQQL